MSRDFTRMLDRYVSEVVASYSQKRDMLRCFPFYTHENLTS